jgi:Mn2+/Fe2+ NRAMP family transporter
MLIIIVLVGTTVAPWQLFFRQSYVIDMQHHAALHQI